jgi:hypothetical protein
MTFVEDGSMPFPPVPQRECLTATPPTARSYAAGSMHCGPSLRELFTYSPTG